MGAHVKLGLTVTVTDIKMDQVKAGTRNGKMLGLSLMLVMSILIVLFSIQIIFQVLVLVYPAYMSVKVSSL